LGLAKVRKAREIREVGGKGNGQSSRDATLGSQEKSMRPKQQKPAGTALVQKPGRGGMGNPDTGELRWGKSPCRSYVGSREISGIEQQGRPNIESDGTIISGREDRERGGGGTNKEHYLIPTTQKEPKKGGTANRKK